jgi:hypothetical protein
MKKHDTLPLLVVCAAIVSCTALVAQAETSDDSVAQPAGSGLRPGTSAGAGLRVCALEREAQPTLACCGAH